MRSSIGLEYERCGSGEAVLLIHGSHIAGSFDPLTREPVLADRFNLIRYHRRGFSGSEAAPPSWSVGDEAADAAALLEDLGIQKSHVVGDSFGGIIALELANSHPASVQTLTVMEPPLIPEDRRQRTREVRDPLLELYRSKPDVAVDVFMRFVLGDTWRQHIDSIVDGGANQAIKDAKRHFEIEYPAHLAWRFHQNPDTRRLPVLHISGGRSTLGSPGLGILRPAYPSLREVTLPGAGHGPRLWDAMGVAQSIGEFLAAHPLTADRTDAT